MFTFKGIIRSFGIRVSSVHKVQTNDLIMGRWKPEYDNVVQERKVYWANMDHCGCCGTNVLNEQIKMNIIGKRREDSDEYILPYVMTM
jgi:hypothetical protein